MIENIGQSDGLMETVYLPFAWTARVILRYKAYLM